MSTVDINVVKAQADLLGIKYHHRAGAEKIAGLVAAHLAMNPQDALRLVPADEKTSFETAASAADKIVATRADGAEPPVKPLSHAQYMKIEGNKRGKEAGRLRRVRLQNMNPAKREWQGEWISVGSSKHGTYKKFIPFNGEPYHVPQIIYDHLQERECTIYTTKKQAKGGSIRVGHTIKEYAIDDLPPLTPEELEDLRKKQALAKAGL